MEWGKKDKKLFKKAIETLCKIIEKTGDTTLVTDGEDGMAIFSLKFVTNWSEPVSVEDPKRH